MFPLETGYTWTHDGIKLVGLSMAGIGTSIIFTNADVCFDVAQGLPFQISTNHILLSHGHMDHAAGLPYLLGQRAMRGLKPARVYLPAPLEDPMRKIMALWSGIEEHAYDFDLRSAAPGDVLELKGNYLARPFATYHRVPSQGYVVLERKKKLRAAFKGLPQAELGLARKRGEEIEERFEDPLVAFTGDTKIEFMESELARRARVLVMEVTYFDQKKGVAEARQWGHIHLDELIPWLDRISAEKILLIHTSARYSKRELERILSERVPERHRDRVELFPRPD